MTDRSINFISGLLGLDPDQRISLEKYIAALESVTGNTQTIDQWVSQNEAQWSLALRALGLTTDAEQAEIRQALDRELALLNDAMLEFFDHPDLSTEAGWSCVLNKISAQLPASERTGFFLKHSVAERLLREHPPTELLEHFGLSSVDALIRAHGVEAIFSSFRFAVSRQYNDRLLELYGTLTAGDFEERQVEFVLLPSADWFELASDFAKAKLHPFSHLKEMGVIFVVPNPTANNRTDVFKLLVTLLMHYLYEVRFYSRYFQRVKQEMPQRFGQILQQTIVGGIVGGDLPEDSVRITHQYYTKKPNPDPRVFEPHVMPEPIHWHNGRRLLRALICSDSKYKSCILDFWDSCYTVGSLVNGVLFSLNYADSIVTEPGAEQKTYHLFEDIWNEIFIAFSSEHDLEEALLKNLEHGYININILG